MLWDSFRSKWVVATPEEQVRQQLLSQMVDGLGYPKSLIAVEREVGTRRFDLLVFFKKKESLLPLLLVECKADSIDELAKQQALGYNESLKAPFICLASKEDRITFWREAGKITSVPFLPSYAQLITYV